MYKWEVTFSNGYIGTYLSTIIKDELMFFSLMEDIFGVGSIRGVHYIGEE